MELKEKYEDEDATDLENVKIFYILFRVI